LLDFKEGVAKFSLEDFRKLFSSQGLRMTETFGDYELNAYQEKGSPRLIIIANKE
jgi:hypothetical protein